ncbi:MAG: T9SS type A sorting domain-containing protein [Bacteroidota bacterium]
MSVIPNPFHDLTQVSIDLMQSGSVEIQLLDINGKLLQSNHYLLADGLQTLPVRADNLQAGIYLLKVKKADETVTLKVVKSN